MERVHCTVTVNYVHSSPCSPPPSHTQGVTEDQVYGVWSQSGLEWSTHLHVPPEDLGYLLEDHVSSHSLHCTTTTYVRDLVHTLVPFTVDPPSCSSLHGGVSRMICL